MVYQSFITSPDQHVTSQASSHTCPVPGHLLMAVLCDGDSFTVTVAPVSRGVRWLPLLLYQTVKTNKMTVNTTSNYFIEYQL